MSALNSLDSLKYSVSKFIGPLVLAILGVIIFMKSRVVVEVIQRNPNVGEKPILHKLVQDSLFGYAGLFLILVAVVWALYALNILKSIFSYIVIAIMVIASYFLLATDYDIVKKDVAFKNKKEKYLKEIKGRLKDVKLAQIEFKKEYGYYTPNMDSLIDYIKNGKTITYERSGVTPDRAITKEERAFLYGKRDNRALDGVMSDIEAKRLSKWEDAPEYTKEWLKGYKRDTVYVSVYETVFLADSYLESRNKKLELDFIPDSLKFVPFAGSKEIHIDTSSVVKGELKVPTILITAVHPLFLKDTLKIGDTTKNDLGDNWSLK